MKKKKKKIAVVLFNLGGPTSPETIQPFLFNFFMDKNIIPFPLPLRFAFSFMISRLRSRRAAGEAYGEMGGKSPLLANTNEQVNALQQLLDQEDDDYRVFLSMRYWHPMSETTVAQVQAYEPDHVVLLSLYPQYSTTTAGSSFQAWKRAAQKYGLKIPTSFVCCYPWHEGFIKASAEKIRPVYEKARAQAKKNKTKMPRLLFSAHSLPLSVIEGGDPYDWQCQKTMEAIVKELNIPDLDYKACYQSKVGPQKWLGPQTEDCVKEAGENGIPVVLYPHAFVSEHVETIVELGIEYRELAEEQGVPDYAVVETVGTHPAFIDMLAQLTKKFKGKEGIFSDEGKRLCPEKFSKCCQLNAPKT